MAPSRSNEVRSALGYRTIKAWRGAVPWYHGRFFRALWAESGQSHDRFDYHDGVTLPIESPQEAMLLMMAAAGGDSEIAKRVLSRTTGHDGQFAEWREQLEAVTPPVNPSPNVLEKK